MFFMSLYIYIYKYEFIFYIELSSINSVLFVDMFQCCLSLWLFPPVFEMRPKTTSVHITVRAEHS